jgi:tight adherence protein C
VSAVAATVGALAGAAAWGAARALGDAARDAGVREWVGGAAGRLRAASPRSVAIALLDAAGRIQERDSRVRAAAIRLHAGPAVWLGEADPGRAAWLALHEGLLLVGVPLFAWLTGDLLVGALAGAGAAVFPSLLARDRWRAGQERLRRELPDVLDLLTLALEAGLSLDAAFARVADILRGGRLAGEIGRMQGEVRFGARRHEAWRAMAERTGNPELREVVQALVQADAMGVGLAPALAGLAQSMRTRRRAQVEEAAHQAPVKLLFPLALFVFPAVFLVLLGPVALTLTGTAP